MFLKLGSEPDFSERLWSFQLGFLLRFTLFFLFAFLNSVIVVQAFATDERL
jgi:hypothetical protein